MSIKPVLVPDHTANDLRRLMDSFAEASTGPTKQQLNESRAAVAAAQGVTEAAKWRTHPDAHDHDTDGSPVPKGGIKSDPLATRQGVSRTQSEKDPKSLAGKFGDKYAKKHGVPTKQLMKNIPLDDIDEQGVTEGAEKEYHVINHKGTPTVVSPNGKMNKNFSSTYDAQQFAKKKNAEIDKKKRVSESDSGTVDMKGKKCTACKKGTYEETSQHDDMDGVLHCDKCRKEVKRHQAAASKKKRVSEGIMDVVKQTFNDCVAGYPQGTSEGQFLQGWARAIRAETGRDIPAEKLTKLYQDYTQRSPEIMQSHGTIDEGKELKAIDGDYYEDSTDFFSMFDQDHFDREEESADGMEIRGYIDDVCVMVFKFSTPDRMGGWGNYDDSALMAEGHDHDSQKNTMKYALNVMVQVAPSATAKKIAIVRMIVLAVWNVKVPDKLYRKV
jgi:hypothetical protein